jgi:hypothetical protein
MAALNCKKGPRWADLLAKLEGRLEKLELL